MRTLVVQKNRVVTSRDMTHTFLFRRANRRVKNRYKEIRVVASFLRLLMPTYGHQRRLRA